MARRDNLDDILRAICENTYFQPPESVKMVYPAIKYERSKIDNKFAGDLPYIQTNGYKVTVMYFDPDSEIPEKVSKLPSCTLETHFTKDGLNHDIFTLYY